MPQRKRGPRQPPGPHAATAAEGEARPRLVWGDREVPLREGENLLGRHAASLLPLDSDSVSRRHARILVSGGQATLEDLGSRNGTLLGGRRLSAPALLSDGDEIRIGEVEMTFRASPSSRRT